MNYTYARARVEKEDKDGVRYTKMQTKGSLLGITPKKRKKKPNRNRRHRLNPARRTVAQNKAAR